MWAEELFNIPPHLAYDVFSFRPRIIDPAVSRWPRRLHYAGAGVVILLLLLRGLSEIALMREHGSDPQMGIWYMFMLVKLSLWLLGGLVVAGLLYLNWGPRIVIFPILFLTLWSYGIVRGTWKLDRLRQTLAEARDASTSPARLEQLVQVPDDIGYERDNRIAANPSSPPEVLRQLYRRGNLGTLMILARRSDTPDDVLQSIADHDLNDKWIREALKSNPELPTAVREKLELHEQPSAD